MKISYIVSVVTVMLVTSATAMADFCSDINNVVNHSGNGFSDLKGSAQGRSGKYINATLKLPKASECYISLKNNSYWCIWPVDSRKGLRSEVEKFSSAVSRCIGGSIDDSSIDDDEPTVYVTTDDVEFYITGDKSDVSVTMSVERR